MKLRFAAFLFILGLIVLSLGMVIAHETLFHGQEPEPPRVRVEMFGWDRADKVLVWSVSTGGLDAEGNFEPVGKPRTFSWNPKAETITFDGTEHELTEEWSDRMNRVFATIILTLYEMSEPATGEVPGAIPDGARAGNEAR